MYSRHHPVAAIRRQLASPTAGIISRLLVSWQAAVMGAGCRRDGRHLPSPSPDL